MKTVEIVYRYGTQESVLAPRPADADAAQRRLNEGNRAFSALLDSLTDEGAPGRRVVQVDARDLGLLGDAENPEQRPFAAIVGCADARVPIELVFSEGPNDLFVVRVAGNVLGNEVLGSLKYAIEHLGGSLKLIAVLGHSGCGAVSAAVDVYLKPVNYLSIATSHALRSIIDRLLVVIQGSAKAMADALGPEIVKRPGYREALIEFSILTNAALAAHTIQQELGRLEAQDVRAVYGVYVINTRQIWAPQAAGVKSGGLACAPGDLAAFAELGVAVARSDRITSLLAAQ